MLSQPGVRGHTYLRSAIGLIGMLYAVSFFLPALRDDLSTGQVVYRVGAGCFVVSLLFLHPAWFANPILLIAVYFFARRKWLLAAVLGLVALVLGLTAFSPPSVDARGTLARFWVGYYLWLASMAAVIVFALLGLRQGEAPTDSPSPRVSE
jgi:hypothetical protein